MRKGRHTHKVSVIDQYPVNKRTSRKEEEGCNSHGIIL
jgi:hypothetical protein